MLPHGISHLEHIGFACMFVGTPGYIFIPTSDIKYQTTNCFSFIVKLLRFTVWPNFKMCFSASLAFLQFLSYISLRMIICSSEPSDRPCRLYYIRTFGQPEELVWVEDKSIHTFHGGFEFERLLLRRRGKQRVQNNKCTVIISLLFTRKLTHV